MCLFIIEIREKSMSIENRGLRFEAPDSDHWSLDAVHCSAPVTAYHAENLVAHTKDANRPGFEIFGMPVEGYEYAVVNRFPYYRVKFIGSKKGRKKLPPRWLFKLWLFFHPEIRKRFKIASKLHETKPWKEYLRRWEREIKPEAIKTHLHLQSIDPKGLDDRDLIDHIKECAKNGTLQYCQHHALTPYAYYSIGDYMAQVQAWTGLSFFHLLEALHYDDEYIQIGVDKEFEELLRELREDEDARHILYSGQTSEEIFDQLKHHSDRLHRLLGSWLDMVGYRIASGYDIADFYALERPDLLIHMLKAGLTQAPHQKTLKTARELSAKIREKVPLEHRATYDELYADACEVLSLKEERALYTYLWSYGLLRRALLAAGERLAQAGTIAHAEDIVDASIDEITDLLERRPSISLQELSERVKYRKTVSIKSAPLFLGERRSVPLEWFPIYIQRPLQALKAVVACRQAKEEPVEELPKEELSKIRGLPASQGIYEGRACVIEGPEDFEQLEKGDILVSHHTSEAYNVILPLIGALVTDAGGVLSHAATVSREYGIPAVVGTHTATSVIKSGMRIQVDGNNGQVKVII